MEEWKGSLVKHDKLFNQQGREVESLRLKFATLNSKKMPTGDALMPPDVRMEKGMIFNMKEREDLGVGEDATEDDVTPDLPPNVNDDMISLERDYKERKGK